MPVIPAPTDPGTALGLAVPSPGPGVCVTCRGPARDGHPGCWCCRRVGAALGCQPGEDPPVVPVAMCRVGDHLHRVLRGYKDASAPGVRARCGVRLRGHLHCFFWGHGACVEEAFGPWDSVAVVPSSVTVPRPWAERPGPGAARGEHPLGAVVDGVPALAGHPRLRLVRRAGPGTAIGHLAPAAGAFGVDGVDGAVTGRRVLLVDDAWVTGARMRSAAAALEAAGARVVAMVVAGRVVDTTAAPGVDRWWRWAGASGSTPRPCACAGRTGCVEGAYRQR